MNDVVSMQIVDTFENLPEEAFDYMNLSARKSTDTLLHIIYLDS